VGMCICLAVYYGLWVRYFVEGREFSSLSQPLAFIPGPMAVFPILYFLFAALWFGSILSVVLLGVFAIGHIANSYTEFK